MAKKTTKKSTIKKVEAIEDVKEIKVDPIEDVKGIIEIVKEIIVDPIILNKRSKVEESNFKILESIFSNYNEKRVSVKPFLTNQLIAVYAYYGLEIQCESCGESILQMYKYLYRKYLDMK
jgi:hypothetical protein